MGESPTYATFESHALALGFDEVLVREWAPGQVVGTHSHPFDVSALVTRGEVWLERDGAVQHLGAGSRFEIAAEMPHTERYGAQGATFWVARRNHQKAASSPASSPPASTPPALAAWHLLVEGRDLSTLRALLADEVVFHSPVVHTPQRGADITAKYLAGAMHVLNNGHFRYVREIVGAHDALLEFTSQIDGVHINGIDLIQWNDAGQITDFKVMVRPLKAVNALHAAMGAMLQTLA